MELIEKSKSENLSSQDKIKTSKQISALKRKKEAQDKIADVFADDNYVYFKLHLQNSDSKYAASSSIPADDFKALFDIKEGALRDNNKLDFEWNKTKSEYEVNYFEDYTNTSLQDGQTYKVKKSDIMIDNINLSGFDK